MTLVRYNQRTKMMLRFAKHESTIDVPNQINARIEIGEEAVDRHFISCNGIESMYFVYSSNFIKLPQ